MSKTIEISLLRRILLVKELKWSVRVERAWADVQVAVIGVECNQSCIRHVEGAPPFYSKPAVACGADRRGQI